MYLFWPIAFWKEDFKKIFLHKFLCKNLTPIVAHPSPVMIWTNINLHCLRMHIKERFWLFSFHTNKFSIIIHQLLLKKHDPSFWQTWICFTYAVLHSVQLKSAQWYGEEVINVEILQTNGQTVGRCTKSDQKSLQ